MLNLKLKTIASLVDQTDIVIDTCCDHAYLAIYLKQKKLCQEVYASDISTSALNNARGNIKKSNLEIETFLSDGFKNINIPNINTAIIAGVGTSTVLNIVSTAPNTINKFIISSNNEHYELRKMMEKQGFYLKKEIVIKEHNKFYPIMSFQKENKKSNKFELKYGKSNNKDYFFYLLQKEQTILNKIPKKHLIKRLKHLKNIYNLKRYL